MRGRIMRELRVSAVRSSRFWGECTFEVYDFLLFLRIFIKKPLKNGGIGKNVLHLRA